MRAADETAVDSAWRIVPISNGPVLAHAARDLKEYLGKWRIENGECKIAEGLIEISVDNSLKELQAKIEVGEKKIRITGATLREKMTAAGFLLASIDMPSRFIEEADIARLSAALASRPKLAVLLHARPEVVVAVGDTFPVSKEAAG